jgi:hypothetical protein
VQQGHPVIFEPHRDQIHTDIQHVRDDQRDQQRPDQRRADRCDRQIARSTPKAPPSPDIKVALRTASMTMDETAIASVVGDQAVGRLTDNPDQTTQDT